jgi:hypothetical protein
MMLLDIFATTNNWQLNPGSSGISITSKSCDREGYALLGCDAMQFGRYQFYYGTCCCLASGQHIPPKHSYLYRFTWRHTRAEHNLHAPCHENIKPHKAWDAFTGWIIKKKFLEHQTWMKSTIFWDIMPYSPLSVNRSWARNQHERRLLAYFFDPEDGGDMLLRNVSW